VVAAGDAYTVDWYVPATYGIVSPALLNNPVAGVQTAGSGTAVAVIVIDHEVRVPRSPPA
jgi:hypothetical protein